MAGICQRCKQDVETPGHQFGMGLLYCTVEIPETPVENEEDEWCCLTASRANVGRSWYICGGCGKNWIWTFDNKGIRLWEEFV